MKGMRKKKRKKYGKKEGKQKDINKQRKRNGEKDELEPFRQVNKQLFDFSKEIDTVPISGM